MTKTLISKQRLDNATNSELVRLLGIGSDSSIRTGATVPTSALQGTLFLHTPTGRNVLLQYDGSTWQPIASYGTTTIYVDNTDGTDAVDKGGAVDAGAYKTLGYAWSSLAGTVYGSVVINVNAETYTEDWSPRNGPTIVGNYAITIQGATTTAKSGTAAAGSVQGTGSTQGTLVDNTGGITVNTHANKFLKITSGTCNGQIRVIDSNTSDTYTICGTWDTAAPSAADTYIVYTPATVFQPSIAAGIFITQTNSSLYFRDIDFSGGGVDDIDIAAASHYIYFWNCRFHKIIGVEVSRGAQFYDCMCDFTAAQGMIAALGVTHVEVVTGKIVNTTASSPSISATDNAEVYIDGGLVIDGIDYARRGGGIYFDVGLSTSYGNARLRNLAIATYADQHGWIIGTATNQYTTNTTDEYAVAADFGLID
jgi:hypothetical protein